MINLYILDEKVRISRRSHPYVIEGYLLGHTEFVSSFLLSNESSDTYYSASGDGTCIKWENSEIKNQTVGANNYIAHSLSLTSSDEVTYALQFHVNPLDNEVKKQNHSIIICDSSLLKLAEYIYDKGECPLASKGTR